ncbi:MAG: hypothetical protein LKG20_02265 [Tetrasphaera jenkinsii]|jgi:uncharacterized membrane protein ArfB|uniref:Uncharacterized protein n=1 Tax=Nostocoides jenkinsii Ben 74 TaxID=1193518 RepID=A0A077MCX9_9MICO|nr:hypothetical protein [Tetrasphaera jenkinsii]MCI1261099.1 hypothetical protein [Tetrasphaera jenkinsii]CCI54414.1 conserved hypothetical protein [Tetrasphaera jenkinsii Ben 74]
MTDFLIAWLWYIVAFALGAVVAWLIARSMIEATNENEAFADVPETRAIGER